MFKRDSTSSSPGSRRGSIASLQQERLNSPRHSVGSNSSGQEGIEQQQQPQETSPAHHMLSRKTSMLNTSIPEEVAEEADKDVLDTEKEVIPKRSIQEDVVHEEPESTSPEPGPETGNLKPETSSEDGQVTTRRKHGTAGIQETSFSTSGKEEDDSAPMQQELPTTSAETTSTSSTDPKTAQTQL